MPIQHYPVMVQNILRKLNQFRHRQTFKIADCNFGLGGHSHAILKSFPNAFIHGYDLDSNVLQYYHQHYHNLLNESQKARLTLYNKNYTQIASNEHRFQAVLADLGYNSYQLEEGRGFSWRIQTELDMRYFKGENTTKASEIVNQSSQLELIQIFKKFGELNEAKQAAAAIISKRPLKTTVDLRQAVVGCFKTDKTRKIAQTFQALRIATNDQLVDLQKLCNALKNKLCQRGIGMVIVFHSLELNVVGKFIQKLEIEIPSEEQLMINSKSTSAKLLSFIKN